MLSPLVVSRRARLLVTLGLALGLASATRAAAQTAQPVTQPQAEKFRPKLFKQASLYVKQYGLQKRHVVVKVGGKKVARVFVPILNEEQRTDFETRFSKQNGSVLWGQSDNIDYYAELITAPDKRFHREYVTGQDYTVMHKPARWMYSNNYQRYIAMELGAEKIAGLETQLLANNTMANWQTAHPGQTLRVPTTGGHGKCMWWMGNAEVAPNTSLWTELGIKRSVAPENIRKRMMHVGNQRVSVIGIPVASLDAFRAMSDADLMGGKPMTQGPNGPIEEPTP